MSARRFEIAAVLVTGMGRFVATEWLGLHLAYVMTTVAFWVAFVLLRHKRDPFVLARWGFTTRGLARSLVEFGPVALAAVIACVLWGIVRGTAVWNTRLVGLLLLYPMWGLVQQFLVVSLLARNLGERYRGLAITVAILLFSAVHLPSLSLVGLGFVLGVYCTVSFFRTPNLWPLGIFHGWLATLVYVFVLQQDPWTDVVSAALSGAAR